MRLLKKKKKKQQGNKTKQKIIEECRTRKSVTSKISAFPVLPEGGKGQVTVPRNSRVFVTSQEGLASTRSSNLLHATTGGKVAGEGGGGRGGGGAVWTLKRHPRMLKQSTSLIFIHGSIRIVDSSEEPERFLAERKWGSFFSSRQKVKLADIKMTHKEGTDSRTTHTQKKWKKVKIDVPLRTAF